MKAAQVKKLNKRREQKRIVDSKVRKLNRHIQRQQLRGEKHL
ncbi:hypothetical protein DFQ00_14223 [Paenibacillus barcinonensis]|uniref:Uncharacterized protein n=1 Tax=Paenibacillus barcinonensis TaxID=198119 RepID=A0A2V4V057_PAEBA|nr:hypothetical protein [Paenibacillus barcinonensis]PYE42126.1 hypothetical protein DFQ00_14223 [Paenibacillus barcinonensis]